MSGLKKSENIAKLLNFWPRKKCLIDLEIPRETWVNDYIEIFLCHFLSIMIPIKFKLINYLNQAQKCVVHYFKKKSTLKIKTNFCYFCNFCCPTETRWFGLMYTRDKRAILSFLQSPLLWQGRRSWVGRMGICPPSF